MPEGRQSTVSVIVVDAVIELSVPVMVTVYAPLGAFPEVDPEDEPEHPPFTRLAAISITAQPATRSTRCRPNPINRTAADTNTACINPRKPFSEPLRCLNPGTSPANSCFPVEPTMLAVLQADAVVFTVRLAVTADVPETAVLGNVKHKLLLEGLLETAHEIVPVYPFCGVIVIVDVPALPAATVTLVALSVKLFVPVDEPLHALSRLLKSIDPSPVARS